MIDVTNARAGCHPKCASRHKSRDAKPVSISRTEKKIPHLLHPSQSDAIAMNPIRAIRRGCAKLGCLTRSRNTPIPLEGPSMYFEIKRSVRPAA